MRSAPSTTTRPSFRLGHSALLAALLTALAAACSSSPADEHGDDGDGGLNASTPSGSDASASDGAATDGGTAKAPLSDAGAGVHDAATAADAGKGDAASCTTLTWTNYAQSFFTTNCVTCHQHTSDFLTYADVTGTTQYGESNIVALITSGGMPENATLSATTKADILKWFSCGAPE